MVDWDKYPDLVRMWETRGARFACHERLSKTNIWTNYAIATGSAYVILLSLIGILNLNIFSSEDYKVINILSIIISVALIFLSLIEGGKNLVAHAEAMHSCAREISVIYHEAEAALKNEKGEGTANLIEFVRKYDAAIDKYKFNHDPLDFLVFKAGKRKIYTDLSNEDVKTIDGRRWRAIYGSFFMVLCGVPALVFVVWFIGVVAPILKRLVAAHCPALG